MVRMKVGKKAVVCVLAALMMAGSAVTVLAAEPSQTPAESSQSVTQQDNGQSAETSEPEKKAKKNKATIDGESGTEGGTKIKKDRKSMNFADGSEDGTGEITKRPERVKKSDTAEENTDGTTEVKKPKRHGKHKSTDDVQTSEDGTETSKRQLHKKSKSANDESKEDTVNA